jgi:hypothetical protein
MLTPAEPLTDERNSEDLHTLVLAPWPGGRRHVAERHRRRDRRSQRARRPPALNESGGAFWMSDSDEATGDAREAGVETVVGLREEGVAAAGTRERHLRQGADMLRCAGHARDALTASWRHAVR